MKKAAKINFLGCLTFMCLILSCTSDTEISDLENDKLTEISNEYKIDQNDPTYKYILYLGFSTNEIIDKGTYYLVSGDIHFGKDENYNVPPKSETRQRQHPNSVTISNIRIYLNPSMNSSWRQASIDAISRWNSLNASLNLTTTTSLANAHIEILYDTSDPDLSLDPNMFGLGDWPSTSGLPGDKIWINPDFNSSYYCGKSITQAMRISNVQHELGHNLGLTHTNQSSFGSLIPGTPSNDSQSVMNGGAACTIDNFSSNDVKAIKYLFPVVTISAGISGPAKAGNYGTYTWTAVVYNGSGPYTYTWYYNYDNGSSYNGPWFTGKSITVSMPLDFNLGLKVIVKNSSGVTVATTTRFILNTGNNNGHP